MAAFVAGLRPSQLPGRAACQLPDQSTIIRVRPSLTDSSRPRGARPIASLRTAKISEPFAAAHCEVGHRPADWAVILFAILQRALSQWGLRECHSTPEDESLYPC